MKRKVVRSPFPKFSRIGLLEQSRLFLYFEVHLKLAEKLGLRSGEDILGPRNSVRGRFLENEIQAKPLSDENRFLKIFVFCTKSIQTKFHLLFSKSWKLIWINFSFSYFNQYLEDWKQTRGEKEKSIEEKKLALVANVFRRHAYSIDSIGHIWRTSKQWRKKSRWLHKSVYFRTNEPWRKKTKLSVAFY